MADYLITMVVLFWVLIPEWRNQRASKRILKGMTRAGYHARPQR